MVHITYRLSQAQDRLTKKKTYPPHSATTKGVLDISWSPCLHTSPYAQCIIANKGAGNKPRVFFIHHNHSVDWVGLGWVEWVSLGIKHPPAFKSCRLPLYSHVRERVGI